MLERPVEKLIIFKDNLREWLKKLTPVEFEAVMGVSDGTPRTTLARREGISRQ